MKKLLIKRIDKDNKIAEIHYSLDDTLLVYHFQLPTDNEGKLLENKDDIVKVFKNAFPKSYFEQEIAKKENVVSEEILSLEGQEFVIEDEPGEVTSHGEADVVNEYEKNETFLYSSMYGGRVEINKIRQMILNVLEELNIIK